MGSASDITGLLIALSNGEETARSRLIEAVYAQLRRLARLHLRREPADQSLPSLALVHDAYLKLIDQRRVQWQNRAHFFAIAGRLMRRILVDRARARRTLRRGRGVSLPLQALDAPVEPFDVDVLALDRALEKLSAQYPRQGQLVELRFFAGLTVEETALVLDVAPITIKRDWALARTWLYREMKGSS